MNIVPTNVPSSSKKYDSSPLDRLCSAGIRSSWPLPQAWVTGTTLECCSWKTLRVSQSFVDLSRSRSLSEGVSGARAGGGVSHPVSRATMVHSAGSTKSLRCMAGCDASGQCNIGSRVRAYLNGAGVATGRESSEGVSSPPRTYDPGRRGVE